MHRPRSAAFDPAQPAFPMPHHAPPLPMQTVPMPLPPPSIPVHRVWADNLEPELDFLHNFAGNARYAAVNIHYPGVVHGTKQNHSLMTADERYGAMKANVDALKPIQVGITIYNDNGHVAAWEFNLRGFHPAADPHAPSSVKYLESRGLSFRDHQAHGITAARLAAGLNSCGLFNRLGISWVTYTGASHIAYLMKVLSAGDPLPDDLGGFLNMVRQLLSEDVYDVARMAVDCGLPAGLERVASTLHLVPAALSPQLAGAGSVLALQAFMRLKDNELGGDVNRFRGLIHGIQVV
ncbi:putative CCR4-associated factor 1-like protein 9 [Dichanthelium oligosanthes]|uniref:poly(A)-specific ribonuclease n=1 Tax=Dichanthelium oligosanthes TaxID=888268 RepID=A0A1E5W147_9POAL|nr:putative CCR4-associated factor 1-like protein 9 [Dichanthelium oligosanthes]